MRKEMLRTVEVIHYESFKEKIKLVQSAEGCCKVTILSETHICIERWKYE